jgi:predicted nucleic acid-binding protein
VGTRYILDTNVILDFMGKNFPEKVQNAIAEIIDEEINISLITKIELLGFSNIIAATAIVYDLTIATRNAADFKNIEDLSVWNPWDLNKNI